MKTSLIAMLIVGTGIIGAQAQEVKKETYPVWTISKDVQKIQFKNTSYTPAEVTTSKTDWFNSKGVHTNKQPRQAVAINKTGAPTWIISKGVARQQAEKTAQK